MKVKGYFWCLLKGFDIVCLVSDFILKEKVKNYSDIEFWFKVNGIIK